MTVPVFPYALQFSLFASSNIDQRCVQLNRYSKYFLFLPNSLILPGSNSIAAYLEFNFSTVSRSSTKNSMFKISKSRTCIYYYLPKIDVIHETEFNDLHCCVCHKLCFSIINLSSPFPQQKLILQSL